MKTIGDVLSEIVGRTPFLEEALSKGLINLSALARYMKPEIAKRLYTSPTDAAVIMALSRLTPTLRTKYHRPEITDLRNLSVRTGLVEYAFHSSTSLFALQKELFSESEADKDLFMSITQGLSEVTLIVSATEAPVVEKMVPKEKIMDKINNLAAITLKLQPEHIYVSGIHYALLKTLAWENINVIETISTYSEVTLIFEEKDLSRAFAAIQSAVSGGVR